MKKLNFIFGFQAFVWLIYILFFIGWVKCLVKFVKCDFDPIGKAELIYGIGTFTGAGGVIGWFDIKDGE